MFDMETWSKGLNLLGDKIKIQNSVSPYLKNLLLSN